VPVDASEDELVAAARESERVRSFIHGAEVRQTIVVPQKLVNIVLESSGTN
jgi:leucyl-tRNA synthetase